MSGTTEISWTDKVWNPVVGCTRVSAGCDHCYAFKVHDQRHVAWRRGRWESAPPQYHEPFSKVQLLPVRLTGPLHWRKPCRVFVNSMSDLFHEAVPDEFIDLVFAVMALTPHITYQLLTKRPERMRAYLTRADAAYDIDCAVERICGDRDWCSPTPCRWPLPNVWAGCSVEDQRRADERIPELLATPAAVRWVSAEPLLGEVNLRIVPNRPLMRFGVGQSAHPGIDWLVCGGESGPGARPCDVGWIRSLVGQCQAAGTAVFVKQLGAKPREHYRDQSEWPVDMKWCGGSDVPPVATSEREADWWAPMLHDRKGGGPEEWPEDLRVQEFPR